MAGEFSVAYFRIVSMSFAPTFTTLNSSPGLSPTPSFANVGGDPDGLRVGKFQRICKIAHYATSWRQRAEPDP